MPVIFYSIYMVISAHFLRVWSVNSSSKYKDIFPVVSRGSNHILEEGKLLMFLNSPNRVKFFVTLV